MAQPNRPAPQRKKEGVTCCQAACQIVTSLITAATIIAAAFGPWWSVEFYAKYPDSCALLPGECPKGTSDGPNMRRRLLQIDHQLDTGLATRSLLQTNGTTGQCAADNVCSIAIGHQFRQFWVNGIQISSECHPDVSTASLLSWSDLCSSLTTQYVECTKIRSNTACGKELDPETQIPVPKLRDYACSAETASRVAFVSIWVCALCVLTAGLASLVLWRTNAGVWVVRIMLAGGPIFYVAIVYFGGILIVKDGWDLFADYTCSMVFHIQQGWAAFLVITAFMSIIGEIVSVMSNMSRARKFEWAPQQQQQQQPQRHQRMTTREPIAGGQQTLSGPPPVLSGAIQMTEAPDLASVSVSMPMPMVEAPPDLGDVEFVAGERMTSKNRRKSSRREL